LIIYLNIYTMKSNIEPSIIIQFITSCRKCDLLYYLYV